jgi:hypothetical protein
VTRSWGYDKTGKHLVESEVVEIRRALIDGLLAGKKRREVVADLRGRGVLTTAGRPWTESALARFAQYPRLAGLQPRDGKLVKAPWPAIITRKQHEQLVKLLRNPANAQPTDNKPKYLLSGGLLRCGCLLAAGEDGEAHQCGKSLYTQPSTKLTRGYVCRSGSPSYGCGRVRISGPAVEDMVTGAVLARLAKPAVIERLKRAAGPVTDQVTVDAALADLDKRLTEAGEQYARRELSMTTLKAIEKGIQSEKQGVLERARQAERLMLLPAPEFLADWWVAATVAQRREMVSLMLDHVVVKPAPRRGNIPLDPDRLEFVWK